MKHSGQIIHIVDDDYSTCLSLKVMLEQHGFTVETFTNATAFLTFKQRKAPECLILDIQMPGISGLILQETMADRKMNTPIVFITGHGNISMSVKAIQAGAVDFLTKPFTEEVLLNAIDRAITKNKIQNKQQAGIATIKRYIKSLSPKEVDIHSYTPVQLIHFNHIFRIQLVAFFNTHSKRITYLVSRPTGLEFLEDFQESL